MYAEVASYTRKLAHSARSLSSVLWLSSPTTNVKYRRSFPSKSKDMGIMYGASSFGSPRTPTFRCEMNDLISAPLIRVTPTGLVSSLLISGTTPTPYITRPPVIAS
jgi:hypothetical protein